MKTRRLAWFFLLIFSLIGCGLKPLTFSQVKSRAEHGDAREQYKLGKMYFYGSQDVERNASNGLEWWRKAGEGGYVKAQYLLGTLYYSGDQGVKRDLVEAAKWFRKAADQGHVESQCMLGKRYVLGEGVPKDFEQAVKLLRKAADAGHPGAQYGLALRYARGEGVDVDDEKTVYWFRRSSEQGYTASQVLLAKRCADGEGVKKSLIEAYKWLTIAIAQENNNAAKKERSALAKKMKPDDIKEGEKLAKAFVPRLEYIPQNENDSEQNPDSDLWLWIGGIVIAMSYGVVLYLFWRKRRRKCEVRQQAPSGASSL